MIRKEAVRSDFISFLRLHQIRANHHIDLNFFISSVRSGSNWSGLEWMFFWDEFIPRMLRGGFVVRGVEKNSLHLTELGEESIY